MAKVLHSRKKLWKRLDGLLAALYNPLTPTALAN
jgi:hypothetical protein